MTSDRWNRCPHCGKTLPPDPELGGAFLRLRGAMWRAAHRLTCPTKKICACGHALLDHYPRVSSDCIECDICDGDMRCTTEGWLL